MRTLALALVTALAVPACAGGGEGGEGRVGRTIQPIIGGSASGTEHDSVVVLTNFVDGAARTLCTATLVAPNLVLTARHCVSDVDGATACHPDGTPIVGGNVRADRPASNLAVYVGKEGGKQPAMTDPDAASARGAKLVVDDATNVCNHDIAFVVLDRALASPFASLHLDPVSDAALVSPVGWGVDESGALSATREVRADMPITGIGPALYPDHASWGYGAMEFMIGESACAGDSGGPAFTTSGAVVGVASRAGNGKPRGDNYANACTGSTAHAVYTQLQPHLALITRAFAEAGAEPWIEGAPKPGSSAAETTDAPAPPVTKAGEPDEAAPASSSPPEPVVPPAAGGCSMATEPQAGSVEYAMGLVALLASLVGLRRRVSRPRERMPSLP